MKVTSNTEENIKGAVWAERSIIYKDPVRTAQ